ncbi:MULTISPECIES: hypothetical protein [unclassified Nonomuraea]
MLVIGTERDPATPYKWAGGWPANWGRVCC